MNKCPKCGAEIVYRDDPLGTGGTIQFACGAVAHHDGRYVNEDWKCLRRQLAAVTAERDRLRVALEFYANNTRTAEHFAWDDGQVARDALMPYAVIDGRTDPVTEDPNKEETK